MGSAILVLVLKSHVIFTSFPIRIIFFRGKFMKTSLSFKSICLADVLFAG